MEGIKTVYEARPVNRGSVYIGYVRSGDQRPKEVLKAEIEERMGVEYEMVEILDITNIGAAACAIPKF